MNFRSSFLQEAAERGFLYQCTNLELLDERLSHGPCTAYVGFDATADSLHVGHLLPIFFLRLFKKHGHNGIALLGGGTTKIGDPSFRNSMRPMLSEDDLAKNILGIKQCIINFLTIVYDDSSIEFVDNSEWLDSLMYIDFLKKVGIHFSVNKMISFDSVKSRLTDNNTISFMEFNYMLMQAYDFLVLKQKYGADIQLGGQDQWGNIVCGVELIRKVCGHEAIGCTVPLLTRSDGTKMGKSVNGAVWLRADKTSPYEFWQYWRNIPDEMVGKCLRLFTDLPIDEIEKLEQLKDKEINEAKIVLADNVTKIAHGIHELRAVHDAVKALFCGGNVDGEKIPCVIIPRNEIKYTSIVEALIRFGAAQSRGEAKRLLRGGGVVLDGLVLGEDYFLRECDYDKKVIVGKKRVFLIRERDI